MNAFPHQVAERGIDRTLALDAASARERGAFDREREMTFAAGVVASVANVVSALVLQIEARRRQGLCEPLDHLTGDGSGGGGGIRHRHYIEGFEARGSGDGTADEMARADRGRGGLLQRSRLP